MTEYFKYLRSTIWCCSSVVLLSIITLIACQKGYLSFIEQFTALTVTEVIHLFGLPAVRDNTVIHLKNAVLVVNTECTAIFIMITFSCLVAFYQTSKKLKIIGILVGLPIIFVVNILRFVIMAFVDQYRPVYLTYFYDYWQYAFVAMALFMWIVWIVTVAKRETKIAHQ